MWRIIQPLQHRQQPDGALFHGRRSDRTAWARILFECKKIRQRAAFLEGHGQLACYARSLGQKRAVYVGFTPEHLRYPDTVVESRATIRKVDIITYLIPYDEVKDFEG